MLSLTHEQKIISIVATLSILILIIGVGVIFPTIRYINKINQDTLNLRLYLEKRYENVRKMHNSLQQVKEIREKVAGYERHLFYSGDELALITSLEDLPTHYGVEQKIESTNLDQANKKQVSIGLVVDGGYNNLLKYLTGIESSDYFLNITQIHWAPFFRAGQTDNQYQIRLLTNLYVNQ